MSCWSWMHGTCTRVQRTKSSGAHERSRRRVRRLRSIHRLVRLFDAVDRRTGGGKWSASIDALTRPRPPGHVSTVLLPVKVWNVRTPVTPPTVAAQRSEQQSASPSADTLYSIFEVQSLHIVNRHCADFLAYRPWPRALAHRECRRHSGSMSRHTLRQPLVRYFRPPAACAESGRTASRRYRLSAVCAQVSSAQCGRDLVSSEHMRSRRWRNCVLCAAASESASPQTMPILCAVYSCFATSNIGRSRGCSAISQRTPTAIASRSGVAAPRAYVSAECGIT